MAHHFASSNNNGVVWEEERVSVTRTTLKIPAGITVGELSHTFYREMSTGLKTTEDIEIHFQLG